MRRHVIAGSLAIALAAMQHAPAQAMVPARDGAAASAEMPVTERGPRHPSMNGVRKSAYKGKYWLDGRGEPFRRCVIQRESNGRYWAQNPTSTAAAAYQWLEPWQESLPWMMRPELRQLYGKRIGDRVFRSLQNVPRHRWPRFFQDMAFFTVLNYDGPFSGARHWYLAGSPCNALAGIR